MSRKSKPELNALIEIESYSGPIYSRNAYGVARYRTEGIGIAVFNVSDYEKYNGKVKVVVFETTKDEEEDTTKPPHFIKGDKVLVKFGDFTERDEVSYRFRDSIPIDAVGQILCDVSDIEVTRDDTAEKKIEADTLDKEIEKLKKEREFLERKIEEIKKELATLNEKRKEVEKLNEEIEELKKEKWTTFNAKRKEIVEKLIELLPIEDPSNVHEIKIDVMDLRRGYEKSFLWR